MHASGRPAPTEHVPYFERYIALVPGEDAMPLLAAQPATFRRALGRLSPEQAGLRYAEGKWSIREVVGHIVDAVRAFDYRALGVARDPSQALPGFDENEFARTAGHDAVPLGELLDEFDSVRAGTVLFFRHLPAEAWLRIGTANSNPISVRAIAFVIAGHAEHHLRLLYDRYRVPRPV